MNIPSWTHKPINIDNLNTIQLELKPLVEKYIPECFNNTQTIHTLYFPLTREEVTAVSPAYVEMIKSTGFLDRWDISVFVATSKLALDKPDIHIDHFDPEQRCYGLNIPLFNCEGTYTIWYDATINRDPVNPKFQDLMSARLIDHDKPYTEIDRLEVSTPAWVNVCIPHAPYSDHEETRVIISARFSPEIHEYFKNP